MNIQIKFNEIEQANKFAGALKDKNLRGARVKQELSKPDDGALDMAEWLPLIKIVVDSGFAAAVVTSVFELLRGIFLEKKKTKTEDETERLRIMANEKVEMAKIEQQSNFVEFTLDDGNKKVNLKFTRGDEAEQAELLKIIKEMTG
jgi:hypothetical protein